MADLLVEATDLHKSFGPTHAVDGVSIQVPAGEIYGLVGPDGAGKTTLMRLLCGAMHPDAGRVMLAGIDLARRTEEARERIGYLAQRFALYEDLTVTGESAVFCRGTWVARQGVGAAQPGDPRVCRAGAL